MSKQYFTELAEYNIWANNIVISWLQQIDETQWQQPIVSSFKSIEQTVLHIVSAEYAWYLRMSNKEFKWIGNEFKGSKEELIQQWKNASDSLEEFVKNMEEEKLEHSLTFTRLNGEVNTKQFYQMIAHVFNHSTYHRGQIVTMLRQVGFEKISSTDLLGFY
jgi:uncharacterized damage-inducible protein DinB